MPAHFEIIKGQLRDDLVAVLAQLSGSAPVVKFGQPLKPIKTYPHSVVRSTVDRMPEGRSVEESYSFEIELKLPIPDPTATDRESYVYQWANSLVMLLAPFAPDEVPEVGGDYAGVGYGRNVSKVVPGDDVDADAFCSVKVYFEVSATVYQ